VHVGDEDSEPVGKAEKFHDFTAAEEAASRIFRDPSLELIQDAMPD